MKDNKDILKAFISGMITLALLYVLMNADISNMPDIIKYMIIMYLVFVFMVHTTFIFTRVLNLRAIFKGKIGNGSVVFEEVYKKFGIFFFFYFSYL